MEASTEWSLAEFEPDPGAALGGGVLEPGGREADGLEWVAWEDAEGELSWAGAELDHMTHAQV